MVTLADKVFFWRSPAVKLKLIGASVVGRRSFKGTPGRGFSTAR